MTPLMTPDRVREVLIAAEQRQAEGYRRALLKLAEQGVTDPVVLAPLAAGLDACRTRLASLGGPTTEA